MMASICIAINTDGPAFHDPQVDSYALEISRILRVMANTFKTDADPDFVFSLGTVTPPRDANGNVVGTVEVIE